MRKRSSFQRSCVYLNGFLFAVFYFKMNLRKNLKPAANYCYELALAELSLNFLYNVYIKLGYSSFSMEDILRTLSDRIGNFSIQRRFQCYWMSKYYLSWISYETLCFVWEIVDSVWIREVTVELKDKCKTFSDNFPKELWITACIATASKIRIFTDIFLVIHFMRFKKKLNEWKCQTQLLFLCHSIRYFFDIFLKKSCASWI